MSQFLPGFSGHVPAGRARPQARHRAKSRRPEEESHHWILVIRPAGLGHAGASAAGGYSGAADGQQLAAPGQPMSSPTAAQAPAARHRTPVHPAPGQPAAEPRARPAFQSPHPDRKHHLPQRRSSASNTLMSSHARLTRRLRPATGRSDRGRRGRGDQAVTRARFHDHELVLDHGTPDACPPARSSAITRPTMITAFRAAPTHRTAMPARPAWPPRAASATGIRAARGSCLRASTFLGR